MILARRRSCRLAGLVVLVLSAAQAPPAAAQTLKDILSFLLTNRSIPTDDFERDEQAASAASAAVSGLLVAELGTLPSHSSSGGFAYRIDPTLGSIMRSSDSFGPVFTDRALTSGAGRVSFGIGYQRFRFREVDGRNLRDGTLVATAAKLRSEAQFFDVETVALELSTDIVTFQSTVGVSDRLDLGAALPIARVRMSGQRVDTYRGARAVQARASGTATGPGDLILRAKYNVIRRAASGVAVGAEARLPTGDEENLLGLGQAMIAPRLILSLEGARAGVHGTAAYVLGGIGNEIDYGTAATLALTRRVTLVGEFAGRRLQSLGRLTETTVPHPRLVNVDTVRLTTTGQATTRVVAVAGLKWNLRSSWLLNVNLIRPVTEAGLNAGWSPVIALDRAFEP